MGKLRRGRSERVHVERITEEWVENNCTNVTERDMEMLRLLSKFSIMSSEHLYYLTPGTQQAAPFYTLFQGRKRCNERIRQLFDLHCVNKASPKLPQGEGTSPQYIWLDRAGIKLLDLNRRAKNEIPQDYKHQSLILDTYCELVIAERCQRWSIIHLEVEEKQETWRLIPDLHAILRFGQKGGLFFIEVDRSEKKEADEKQKLHAYKDWQLSGIWKNEPWQKKLPHPSFPRIVYLFDETKRHWKKRAHSLATYANEIGLKADFMGWSEFNHYCERFQT